MLHALIWLKTNNRFYHDIEIDLNNIFALPVDGISTEIIQVEVTDASNESLETGPPVEESHITPLLMNNQSEHNGSSDSESDDISCSVSSSFLSQLQQVPSEEDAIRAGVKGDDQLQWPSLSTNGLIIKMISRLMD